MSRPLLSDKFFTQIKPPQGFWEKWGHQAPWTEALVPLYEWESVLFVGAPLESLTSNPEPKWGFKVVMISASAVELQTYFTELKALAKPVRIPGSNAPTLTNDGVPADPFAALGDFSSGEKSSSKIEILADIPEESHENAAPAAEAEEVEELQLLSDEEVRKVTPPISFQDPEAIQFASEATAARSPLPEPITAAAESADIVPPAPPAPKANSPQVVSEVTTPIALTSTKITAATNSGKDDPSKKFFEQMRIHYQKSMFLKKEGNALVAWRWDDQFQVSKHPDEPISLGIPSPFRIVSRTGKPYHGHIVPGEIQEKFFDEWNQSQLPDFLTISPVLVNDQVIGMLLSLADKHVNLKASLLLSEKVAEDFAKIYAASPQLLVAS